MPDFASALWNKPASVEGGGSEAHDGAPDPVTRSLRFDGSAYLSRSTGSTSTTWTLAFWVKRSTISGPSQAQYLATWGISGSAGEGLSFRGTTDSSNTDKLGFWNGSSTTYSTGVYRDPAAWAHICISVSSGTATVYYNGESILSGITGVQAWGSMRLGAWLNQNELEGYMADVYGVESSALDHTSFTTSNSYGGLKPASYSGALGTNGFHLLFENTSAIGEDDAGSNDFTATNFSNDVMLDVPYPKNYATLNPLDANSAGLSNGNLDANLTTVNGAAKSTIAVSSGKWYWEVLSGNSYAEDMVGIAKTGTSVSGYFGSHSGSYGYYKTNGFKYNNASGTSYGATYANGDIIGVALDLDNGTLTFYKNNSSQGTAFTGLSGEFFAGLSTAGTGGSQVINFGQDPTFGGNKTSGQDTSQSEFYYAPPTGFKSLNTNNLGTPTVNPEEYFSAKTYTGANGGEEINLGFTPDLIWIKRRQDSGYYHGLYDSARGLSAGALASNTTDSEDSTQRVASFDSNAGSEGFTLASSHYSYTNTSNKGYISWNWKESASAGFDIVTYEGDSDSSGDSQNISHSLGVAPEMIIVKARDGRAYNDYYHEDNWYVWHKDLGTDSLVFLNSNNNQMDYSYGSGYAPIRSVGASTFTVSNEEDGDYYANYLNWGDPYEYYTGDNERYIAYLFSGVEGFSKFGKYTGGERRFIYTGFEVGFWMVKRIDSSGHWTIFDSARDTHNLVDHQLEPNYSTAEASSSTKGGDFLSNGFKVRSSQSEVDASGGTYIWAAFSSSSPFRYANAK